MDAEVRGHAPGSSARALSLLDFSRRTKEVLWRGKAKVFVETAGQVRAWRQSTVKAWREGRREGGSQLSQQSCWVQGHFGSILAAWGSGMWQEPLPKYVTVLPQAHINLGLCEWLGPHCPVCSSSCPPQAASSAAGVSKQARSG